MSKATGKKKLAAPRMSTAEEVARHWHGNEGRELGSEERDQAHRISVKYATDQQDEFDLYLFDDKSAVILPHHFDRRLRALIFDKLSATGRSGRNAKSRK